MVFDNNIVAAKLNQPFSDQKTPMVYMVVTLIRVAINRMEESEMINSFTGQHQFLSNFYPCKIQVFGLEFLNSEAAFQSQKFLDKDAQLQFCCIDASTAKHLGHSRQWRLRSDWEQVKVTIMKQVLQAKFSDPILGRLLVDTYPQKLVEGNTWGDTYWGVCDGVGHNMLGRLLMKTREKLMEGNQ